MKGGRKGGKGWSEGEEGIEERKGKGGGEEEGSE